MSLPQGLTREQAEACRHAVGEWIRLLNANAKASCGVVPSAADADHSSLLLRLLLGKPALPYPPPRAFSYPNYDLVETGRYVAFEVGELGEHWGKDKLGIDQSTQWQILERPAPKTWVVCYRDGGERYLVRWEKEVTEVAVRKGTGYEKVKMDGWLVTRIEETEAKEK
jgi:hypothetical protein